MTNQDLVEVVVIVDRSGSMSAMRDEAIGGFNDFLQQQKELPGRANFTLVLFDHEYELYLDGVDLQAVRPLNSDTYVPRGTTALLDAIGRTIDDVGRRLAATPEAERPSKVIVCILTDGLENASKDYSKSRVAEMVKHQESKYAWEFIFLAAGLGAMQSAQMVDMQRVAHAVPADGAGMQEAFAVYSSRVSDARQGTSGKSSSKDDSAAA